jgi:engulfment and cell motility protein 1
MMLINSLLAHASDSRWEEFISSLEKLSISKAVIVSIISTFRIVLDFAHVTVQRLMSSHTMEDLTSCILDFQANMVMVTYRKKMTPVDPESNFSHGADLRFLWETSRLQEEVDENGDLLRWRNLGFDSEDIEHEFTNVGVLGLECLVRLLGLVFLIDLPHLLVRDHSSKETPISQR